MSISIKPIVSQQLTTKTNQYKSNQSIQNPKQDVSFGMKFAYNSVGLRVVLEELKKTPREIVAYMANTKNVVKEFNQSKIIDEIFDIYLKNHLENNKTKFIAECGEENIQELEDAIRGILGKKKSIFDRVLKKPLITKEDLIPDYKSKIIALDFSKVEKYPDWIKITSRPLDQNSQILRSSDFVIDPNRQQTLLCNHMESVADFSFERRVGELFKQAKGRIGIHDFSKEELEKLSSETRNFAQELADKRTADILDRLTSDGLVM